MQDLIEKKTFLWCLCILILLLWRGWFIYQESMVTQLVVYAEKTKLNTAKIYYDQGYGINEHDAAMSAGKISLFDKENSVLIFEVNVDEIFQLFLSPNIINDEIFVIKSMVIKNNLNKNFYTFRLANLLAENDAVISSLNNDKFCISAGPSGNEPLINIKFDSSSIQIQKYRLQKLGFLSRFIVEFLILFLSLILATKYSACILSIFWSSQLVKALQQDSVQTWIVLIVITSIILWSYRPLSESYFPLLFEKSIYIFLIIFLLKFALNHVGVIKNIYIILYVIAIYYIIVIVSSIAHYFALEQVNNFEFISYWSKEFQGVLFWKSMWNKYIIEYNYFYLFPITFFCGIAIFYLNNNTSKLISIAILYIPCAVVALYQIYIDKSFLNYRPNIDFVGGLASSFISFRILLFLIIPLYVLAAILVKNKCYKFIYINMIIIILWLAKLSEGRAAIIGILCFFLTLPMIYLWVYHAFSNVKNKLIVIAVFFSLALSTLYGVSNNKYFYDTFVKITTKNTADTVIALVRGNVAIDPRGEMTRQSLRLIELSPISGWGPAAFMKHSDRIRFINGESNGVTQPMTNLYLQIWLNFGLIGTIVIVSILLLPIYMIISVRNNIVGINNRYEVAIIFSTVCIMFLLFLTNPNIDYHEVSWVYSLYLGYLVAVAVKHGYSIYKINMYMYTIIGISLVVCYVTETYRTTLGDHGYQAIRDNILSIITKNMCPGTSVMMWNNKHTTEFMSSYNSIIKTRGNPFRMRYSTNEFRLQDHSSCLMVDSSSKFFCIKVNTVSRNINNSKYIFGIKVFVNGQLLDNHNFWADGEKLLFYQQPKLGNELNTLEIAVDLRKSIPYHQDYRNNFIQEYLFDHKDYSDLDIQVSYIPYFNSAVPCMP